MQLEADDEGGEKKEDATGQRGWKEVVEKGTGEHMTMDLQLHGCK